MNTYPEFVLNLGDRMAEHMTLRDFEGNMSKTCHPRIVNDFKCSSTNSQGRLLIPVIGIYK